MMAWTSVLLLAVVCLSGSYAQNGTQGLVAKAGLPDVLQVPDLVTDHGYPVETHYIETKDNYILQLHRIPHGKNQQPQEGKPVVFFMHGLTSNSADWLLMEERALPFILADMGYDVWMGNSRGNRYSRKHTTWNPDEHGEFWQFSWHEIGVIDLPTSIDYVLETTGQKDLYYIGHSQGTTSVFVMTSFLPEYNEKLRLVIALAPVAYMSNIPNFALKLISQFHTTIGWVTNMIGLNEFIPSTKFKDILKQIFCNDNSIVKDLCSNTLFLIAGSKNPNIDPSIVPYIQRSPGGASSKQFLHYAQSIKSGHFRQYDFGLIKNMAKYRSIKPPKYETSQITCPVAMLYANSDTLTSREDIYKLSQEIQHLVIMWQVKDPNFGHTDFLWNNDVHNTLYPKVFSLLSRF